MPRKTTILIAILAVITGVLIFLAVRSDTTQQLLNSVNKTPSVSPATTQPYAQLKFSLDVLDMSSTSASQTVDVIINTPKPVAGAQVELTFDPTVLTNVRVIPAQNSFFGSKSTTLINSVDQLQGRISYAVSMGLNDTEKSGTGTIMRLGFTVNKPTGVNNSTISFLSKSAVTTLATQESVLLNSSPLQIILAAPSPTR